MKTIEVPAVEVLGGYECQKGRELMSVDMLLLDEKVAPLTLYVSYDRCIRILQPGFCNFLVKENGLLISSWFVNATFVKSSSNHNVLTSRSQTQAFLHYLLLKAFLSTVDALLICLIFLFPPILIWDVKLGNP